MSGAESVRHKLLIDGVWRAGATDAWLEILNPATEAVIGHLAVATKADLDEALAAAQKGFLTWRAVAPYERARLLRKAGELLRARARPVAELLTLEQGKPLAQAQLEIATSADIFDWNAEEAKRVYGRIIPARQANVYQAVVREPVGPVAAFTPWNFPASQAVRKIAASLAAGCSIILKGPEEAPGAVIALAEVLMEAGLPAGVLNLVFGHPAEISEHLIPSPVIRKVSFTGSVPVGKHLAALAAQYMKPTTMELGGHSPVLVCDDADPQVAAKIMVAAKYRNAGQVCVSPTRFYVQEKVYEPFAEAFAAGARAQSVGDGLDPATRMGPLANARRLQAVTDLVADAVGKGARLLAGGARIGNQGYFFEPTVLADLAPDSRILHEEPFAPVALLLPFGALEEAIAKANDTGFGLASYGFTGSVATAERLAAELEAGMVAINGAPLALPETPFGGIKESGYGREGGSEGIEPYLITKFVSRQTL